MKTITPLEEVKTIKPSKKKVLDDESLEIWDADDNKNTELDFGKSIIELILRLKETALKVKP